MGSGGPVGHRVPGGSGAEMAVADIVELGVGGSPASLDGALAVEVVIERLVGPFLLDRGAAYAGGNRRRRGR